jgi:hypothetical protein
MTGDLPDEVPATKLPATASTGDRQDADSDSVSLLAAALRADAADLESYERVLAATIQTVLPEGMLEIVRERTMADRIASRPGKVVAIRAHFGDASLELTSGRSGLQGLLIREVRGVTISSKPVTLGEWTHLFAEHLEVIASESAAARAALARFLGTN